METTTFILIELMTIDDEPHIVSKLLDISYEQDKMVIVKSEWDYLGDEPIEIQYKEDEFGLMVLSFTSKDESPRIFISEEPDKLTYIEGEVIEDNEDRGSFILRKVSGVSAGETDDDEFRTPLACAQRCIILYGIVSASRGEDRGKIISWLKNEKLWEYVSNEEMVFLESNTPSEQQITNATWRVEALHLLLWALNKVDFAKNLSETCDVEIVKSVCNFYLTNTKNFLESPRLRDESEIYDLNELIYNSHWEVRDAQINNKAIPDDLDSSVVEEKHYAINWLMGYCGQEWDEISTDT